MSFTIERYTPSKRKEWDEFVAQAKNSTFLFFRDYMDYHSDRFHDHSLIARNKSGKIVALLPANIVNDTLVSHGGLTYGGWLGKYTDFDIISLLEIQSSASTYLAAEGVKEIIYKPIPYIYSEIPAQEDIYMLFRNNARLTASQVSATINLRTDAGLDYERRRKARIAAEKGITIQQSSDFAPFWDILTELLQTKFGRKPVHTLDEITRLHNHFPDNILHFTATLDGKLLAGTVVYICGNVVHSQYIAATDEGKHLNAVVLLHQQIINRFRDEGFHWFDFGISTEDAGQYLNEGLARQKISLGGRAITYDVYSLPISHQE